MGKMTRNRANRTLNKFAVKRQRHSEDVDERARVARARSIVVCQAVKPEHREAVAAVEQEVRA